MNTTSASLTPEQALEKLQALYDQSVTALRNAISVYIDNHSLPDAKARADGLFVYPQLSVSWSGNAHKAQKTRAFGRFTHSGCYTTTITHPTLFRPYLLEQLTLLHEDYDAHIEVGLSQHEIPYPYVIDGLMLDRSMSADLTRFFLRLNWLRLVMKRRMAFSIPPSSIRFRTLTRVVWTSRSPACVTTPARR